MPELIFLEAPGEDLEQLKEGIQKDLLEFFQFFKSYNHMVSMGPGMAATFIMRRDSLEYKLNKLNG